MSSRKLLLSLSKANLIARRKKIKRLKTQIKGGKYEAPRRAVARAIILSL